MVTCESCGSDRVVSYYDHEEGYCLDCGSDVTFIVHEQEYEQTHE